MEKEFYRYNEKSILELREVSLSYLNARNPSCSRNVIVDFNLEVHEGEFLVLVGPSGCGKTTLLSLMAGILPPTKGEVMMCGERIVGLDWRREIVFQSPTLYPWYDVYENVAYGPKMRRLNKDEIHFKVEKYLKMVGLENDIHSKVYELSGGMKQRTALARVLINEPEVILMDEPFGALDAFTRSRMQIMMRNIWRESKRTIVLITHDVDEALELASRIVVLGKEPCAIKGMFNAMFSTPLKGDSSDDAMRENGEYIRLRRKILDLL